MTHQKEKNKLKKEIKRGKKASKTTLTATPQPPISRETFTSNVAELCVRGISKGFLQFRLQSHTFQNRIHWLLLGDPNFSCESKIKSLQAEPQHQFNKPFRCTAVGWGLHNRKDRGAQDLEKHQETSNPFPLDS